MLKVMAATRYALHTRNIEATIPQRNIPTAYVKAVRGKKVADNPPSAAPKAVPTNRCQEPGKGSMVDSSMTMVEIGAQ